MDNQRGVDAEKLAIEFAKTFCNIKESVNMRDSDESYYNPKYKEYTSCIAGYIAGSKALQSNTGGYSLEDMYKAMNWAISEREIAVERLPILDIQDPDLKNKLDKRFADAGIKIEQFFQSLPKSPAPKGMTIEECKDAIGKLNGQDTFKAYLNALLTGYLNSGSHRIEIETLIIEAVNEAMQLCASQQSPNVAEKRKWTVTEAVEFAKWIIKEKFELHEPNGKYFQEGFPNLMSEHHNKWYEIEQLYELFKQNQ